MQPGGLRVGLCGDQPALFGFQKGQVEGQFEPRTLGLHLVEDFLVVDRLGADGVRALSVDVLNAAQQCIRGGLAFVEAAEGLGLAHQALAAGLQHRPLAGQVARGPGERVSEQDGRLVIEVVAGDQDVVAAIQGRPVHDVTFGQPAYGAGLVLAALRAGGGLRDRGAFQRGDIDDRQAQPSVGGEVFGQALRFARVGQPAVNAQADVQPVGLVSEPVQHVPQAERVLAARNRHEEPRLRPEHAVLLNEALGLFGQPLQVMLPAERQLVLAHIDGGFGPALPAFHRTALRASGPPPEMTATRRISSPSRRISSSVSSSP